MACLCEADTQPLQGERLSGGMHNEVPHLQLKRKSADRTDSEHLNAGKRHHGSSLGSKLGAIAAAALEAYLDVFPYPLKAASSGPDAFIEALRCGRDVAVDDNDRAASMTQTCQRPPAMHTLPSKRFLALITSYLPIHMRFRLQLVGKEFKSVLDEQEAWGPKLELDPQLCGVLLQDSMNMQSKNSILPSGIFTVRCLWLSLMPEEDLPLPGSPLALLCAVAVIRFPQLEEVVVRNIEGSDLESNVTAPPLLADLPMRLREVLPYMHITPGTRLGGYNLRTSIFRDFGFFKVDTEGRQYCEPWLLRARRNADPFPDLNQCRAENQTRLNCLREGGYEQVQSELATEFTDVDAVFLYEHACAVKHGKHCLVTANVGPSPWLREIDMRLLRRDYTPMMELLRERFPTCLPGHGAGNSARRRFQNIAT